MVGEPRKAIYVLAIPWQVAKAFERDYRRS